MIKGKQKATSALFEHNGHKVLLERETPTVFKIHLAEQNGHGINRNCRRMRMGEITELIARAKQNGDRLIEFEANGFRASVQGRQFEKAFNRFTAP